MHLPTQSCEEPNIKPRTSFHVPPHFLVRRPAGFDPARRRAFRLEGRRRGRPRPPREDRLRALRQGGRGARLPRHGLSLLRRRSGPRAFRHAEARRLGHVQGQAPDQGPRPRKRLDLRPLSTPPLPEAMKPENRGIYTQSDSSKKSSRNIWSLAVVSVDQRY